MASRAFDVRVMFVAELAVEEGIRSIGDLFLVGAVRLIVEPHFL